MQVGLAMAVLDGVRHHPDVCRTSSMWGGDESAWEWAGCPYYCAGVVSIHRAAHNMQLWLSGGISCILGLLDESVHKGWLRYIHNLPLPFFSPLMPHNF